MEIYHRFSGEEHEYLKAATGILLLRAVPISAYILFWLTFAPKSLYLLFERLLTKVR